MEVLRDSPSGQSHYRRKRDAVEDSGRRLDWSVHDNDILLQPRSPCSLDHALGQASLCIDLLPAPDTLVTTGMDESAASGAASSAPEASTPDPSVSAAAGGPAPQAKLRAHLVTCHPAGELQRVCKQVLVENALIKQRGQRRLVLAAGFVDLPVVDSQARRRRAPLLFYPVILVRRADADTDVEPAAKTGEPAPVHPDDAVPQKRFDYELRLNGELPEMNDQLVVECRSLFKVDLPEPARHESLNLYFSRVAQALGASDELHLSMEMALGSCTTALPVDMPLEAAILPELPAGFDPILARQLIEGASLDDLDLLLDLLDDGSLMPPSMDDTGVVAALAPGADGQAAVRERLHDFSVALVEHKIGHVEFRRLPSLPRKLDRWSSSVRACLGTDLIADVLAAPDIASRQLVKLAGIIELLDKAPDRLADFAHPDLCHRATAGLLQRARHQARLIEEELKASQLWFNLDMIPPRHRLLQLMDELETTLDRDPELVGATYFSARRQFVEFSVDKPTQVDAAHLGRLRELAKLLRFRELFINNPEYRLALGPGYRGLRTDWVALAHSAAYARELAESMGSESLAGKILLDWPRFRRAFMADLTTLQRGADHLRKLLWALGAHWQVEAADQVLRQARDTMVPLATLLDSFDDVAGQAADATPSPMAATPAELLTLHGRPGSSLAASNRLAERSRTELQQRLASGDLSAENVIDTLGWLREASALSRAQAIGNAGNPLAWIATRLQGVESPV